ncbi:dTDP-4-dehydrorhamnose reductase [Candidatus Thioglobus sp.]|nr:dTDP-4-dehydrorhamnose reductase [Candidatus Thioglobus sp.]
MIILVTGANGQLGKSIKSLVEPQKKSYSFVFVTRDQLDLSSPSNIQNYFDTHKFDLIINCAAYTAVDKAESYQEEADMINHIAVKKIAEIAKSNNIKLIHISTDFVFDGLKHKPYSESDACSSLNIYGKTKLEGENAILSIMKFNATIIRTSWLYSEYGNNFVSTIIKLAQKNNNLNIVSDQMGTPTYAKDLGQAILNIIKNEKFNEPNRVTEIYHYSNKGECSWYDFAKEVINISGIKCTISSINSEDYPTAARRPRNTIMSKEKISNEFGLKIVFWKDSLKCCMKNLSTLSLLNKE